MYLVPTNDERNEATMETTNANTDKVAVVKTTAGSVVAGILMVLTATFVLSLIVFSATQGYGRWLVLSNGSLEFFVSEVAARVISITVILSALTLGVFIGLGISRNFGFREDEDKDEKS